MASGNFSSSIVSGHYTLYVSWSSTPNPATNTSSVVVTAYLNNDWSLQVGSRTVTNVVNGVTQTYTAAGINTTGSHELGSVTQSVDHNSDGTKTINISVTYPINATIRDTYYSSITATQSVTLDNIPRTSSISSVTSNVIVGTSGGVVTVNINRASSAFTHSVRFDFGGHTHTETNVATSVSYTIPPEWLDAIPTSLSGNATVTVTTYSGTTEIGSTSPATFTVTANVNPTISSVSVSPSGNPSGVTAYVAGYTNATVTANSVSGVYGSSVARVDFLKDGNVIAQDTQSPYSITTTTPLSGTSATFAAKVTDTRGRTATVNASQITIQPYSVPSITANAYRSNSTGTADNSGTYIKITASATAYPTGSGNSISALKYQTKQTTSSTWSTAANIPSSAQAGFDNTKSYDVRIYATDLFNNTSYANFTISTQVYTMDFKVGGTGVAFGKIAETDNTVESAWNIKAPNLLEIH